MSKVCTCVKHLAHQVPCPECKGDRKKLHGRKCGECGGTGTVSRYVIDEVDRHCPEHGGG